MAYIRIIEYFGRIICGKYGAKYISNTNKGRNFIIVAQKLKETKYHNNFNASLKDLDKQINELLKKILQSNIKGLKFLNFLFLIML